jgi:hypothetical protein
MVVGNQRQNPGIEQFGVIEHAAHKADLGKQAHGFGMIAHGQQEFAHDHFGNIDFAVAQQHLGAQHRRGQAGKVRAVAGGNGRIRGVSGHSPQSVEHPPGHGERRVDRDRRLQRGNRLGRIAQRDMAQSAFLQHQTVAWLPRGQTVEHRQRLIGAPQMTQRDRRNQQEITIFGMPGQQRPDAIQRALVVVLCLHRAQARDLGFER